jgi:hypothetical protein
MAPTEQAQEHDRVQDLLIQQRQQWQEINARMSQNFSNRPLYARLELEIKQTEREIARLELIRDDPDALEEVPLAREEEIVVPAPSPEIIRQGRPAPPIVVFGVFALIILILLVAAIWLF